MKSTLYKLLTDPSARTLTSTEVSLANELSAGAPWYDEAA